VLVEHFHELVPRFGRRLALGDDDKVCASREQRQPISGERAMVRPRFIVDEHGEQLGQSLHHRCLENKIQCNVQCSITLFVQ